MMKRLGALILLTLAACTGKAPGTAPAAGNGDPVVASNGSKDDGGGWVSSGGELFQDAHNPWFLKDAGVVRYCYRRDAQAFSLSEDEVDVVLRESLDFWARDLSLDSALMLEQRLERQKTFERLLELPESELPDDAEIRRHLDEYRRRLDRYGAPNLTFPARYLALPDRLDATERTWLRQPECGSDTDVTFVLGSGALTDEERRFVHKPRDYVGLAARSESSPDRGRGFVLVASDRGPDARAARMPPDLWSSDARSRWPHAYLKHVLLHELGHVFGVRHLPAGLMAEGHLDALIRKARSEEGQAREIDQMDSDFSICAPNAVVSFPSRHLETCSMSVFSRLHDGFALDFVDEDGAQVALLRAMHRSRDPIGRIRLDRRLTSAFLPMAESMSHLAPIRLMVPDRAGALVAIHETWTIGAFTAEARLDEGAAKAFGLEPAADGVPVVFKLIAGRLSLSTSSGRLLLDWQ